MFTGCQEALVIKTRLLQILSEEIGTYVPKIAGNSLTPVPAIWTNAGNPYDFWSIKKALPNQQPVPGLEIIIAYSPQWRSVSKSLNGSHKVSRYLPVTFLWHEPRQRTDEAVYIMLDEFEIEFVPDIISAGVDRLQQTTFQLNL